MIEFIIKRVNIQDSDTILHSRVEVKIWTKLILRGARRRSAKIVGAQRILVKFCRARKRLTEICEARRGPVKIGGDLQSSRNIKGAQQSSAEIVGAQWWVVKLGVVTHSLAEFERTREISLEFGKV